MKLIEILEQLLEEEKKKADRCLRIARRKFDKSSAYRSGAIVRCRQGKIWKGLKETDDPQSGKAAPYGSGYAELTEYSTKIITQLINKFKLEKPDLDDNTITTYINRFSQIKDNPNIPQKDITKYTWNDLEKVINNNQSKRVKAGKLNDGEPSKDANLVYNQNNLRIYAGTTKNACIKYGNGYSFCISARGSQNMYSDYRIGDSGTPYFIFDDTKTSEKSKNGKFKDPKHLLVVFIYTPEDDDAYYTITTADNDGETSFIKFSEIESKYPKLKGLKNIFKSIKVNPKEKAEYDLEEKYFGLLNNIKLQYIRKELMKGTEFDLLNIKTADEKIDDLIDGNILLYRATAILKPKVAKTKNEYPFPSISQGKFVKYDENVDDVRKNFIKDVAGYNETSIEDVINNWNIYLVKRKNPAYEQYFQDVKALVDQYRSEIAKLNLLKEIIKEVIQEDESLRKWFKRRGTPGKEGGWVDCNTCRNGKCKPCGRKKGEKRAKYPSCRPTPAQCKTKGKGKKWGKTK